MSGGGSQALKAPAAAPAPPPGTPTQAKKPKRAPSKSPVKSTPVATPTPTAAPPPPPPPPPAADFAALDSCAIAQQAAVEFPVRPVTVGALESCFANGKAHSHTKPRKLPPVPARAPGPRCDLRHLHSVLFDVAEVAANRGLAAKAIKLSGVRAPRSVPAGYAMLSVRTSHSFVCS